MENDGVEGYVHVYIFINTQKYNLSSILIQFWYFLDFYTICAPTVTSALCTTNGVYNAYYTGGSFCTGSASDVKEARLSFPSGHARYIVKS